MTVQAAATKNTYATLAVHLLAGAKQVAELQKPHAQEQICTIQLFLKQEEVNEVIVESQVQQMVKRLQVLAENQDTEFQLVAINAQVALGLGLKTDVLNAPNKKSPAKDAGLFLEIFKIKSYT